MTSYEYLIESLVRSDLDIVNTNGIDLQFVEQQTEEIFSHAVKQNMFAWDYVDQSIFKEY
jgi:hypothetical protein